MHNLSVSMMRGHLKTKYPFNFPFPEVLQCFITLKEIPDFLVWDGGYHFLISKEKCVCVF